jgi:hypothetical protein
MMDFAFSFFFSFLLVTALVQRLAKRLWKGPWGWRAALISAVVSGLIVIIPIRGFPIGRWVVCINANFSITLTALLLSKVLEGGIGVRLLDRRGLFGVWIFALSASTILYPMALGLGSLDPYALGWGFSWLFAALLAATVLLLFSRNRLGLVLMACVLCYDLDLLESQNLWDYLIDPFLVIIAGGALGDQLIRKIVTVQRFKASKVQGSL